MLYPAFHLVLHKKKKNTLLINSSRYFHFFSIDTICLPRTSNQFPKGRMARNQSLEILQYNIIENYIMIFC